MAAMLLCSCDNHASDGVDLPEKSAETVISEDIGAVTSAKARKTESQKTTAKAVTTATFPTAAASSSETTVTTTLPITTTVPATTTVQTTTSAPATTTTPATTTAPQTTTVPTTTTVPSTTAAPATTTVKTTTAAPTTVSEKTKESSAYPQAEQVDEDIEEQAAPFESDFIVRDGLNISDDIMYKVEEYYNTVPSTVRDHFVSDGWKIIVSTDVESRWNSMFSSKAPKLLSGFATTEYKAVYVAARKDALESVIHEIGHYVDYRVWINSKYELRPSKESEFTSIFNSEFDAFVDAFSPWDSGSYDSVEYFAEAFYEYVHDAETLKKVCPNTYNYLIKYI